MNDLMKKALSRIEEDNGKELRAMTSEHRFDRRFDRRAEAVCRGEAFSESKRSGFILFHRLPVWAALLLLLLACTLVAGCAVAVHRYLTRYIPGFGITDVKSNVSLFATEEEFTIGEMRIETLLYVGEDTGGKLMIWANGPALGGWTDPTWMERPVFSVEAEGRTYQAFAVSASTNEAGGSYQCEVAEMPFAKDLMLVRGEDRTEVRLTDQTDRGYTVAGWGEYDGITIKALPLYSNNRIVFVQTEGIEDAEYVTASITMYDSLGNHVTSGSGSIDEDGFVIRMPDALPGRVVRIEIDSLRVTTLSGGSMVLTLPKDGDEIDTDITLTDNSVFTETLVHIDRSGENVILTTRFDVHRYAPLTDVFVFYDSPDAAVGDFNMEGSNATKYNLTLYEKDADCITLIPRRFVFIIQNADGPLCSIEVK